MARPTASRCPWVNAHGTPARCARDPSDPCGAGVACGGEATALFRRESSRLPLLGSFHSSGAGCPVQERTCVAPSVTLKSQTPLYRWPIAVAPWQSLGGQGVRRRPEERAALFLGCDFLVLPFLACCCMRMSGRFLLYPICTARARPEGVFVWKGVRQREFAFLNVAGIDMEGTGGSITRIRADFLVRISSKQE